MASRMETSGCWWGPSQVCVASERRDGEMLSGFLPCDHFRLNESSALLRCAWPTEVTPSAGISGQSTLLLSPPAAFIAHCVIP